MSQITFDGAGPPGGGTQRKLIIAGVGIAIVLAGWLLYRMLTAVHGVPVPPAPVTSIEMLPPPPPPPPPPPSPKEPPPEPSASPTPAPTPTPQPQAPAPMQIDSAAQAGSDAFGLGAGQGGGMGAPSSAGTCLGAKCGAAPSGGISDAFYGRYLSGELQERVQREKSVNRLVFTAEFAIWITPSGSVSRVNLVRGSGDDRRDRQLASILNSVNGLNAPPPSLRFPQRITVRGRKSL